MSHSGVPARDTSETPSQREKIRSHMKMVIEQLEGILQELKEVARELREVVGQIDKLTSDFDFDLEPDDWTVATASSTSSSERGLGDTFRLDFLNADVLSDSWEFCGFLEGPTPNARPDPKLSDMTLEQEDGTPPPATATYSQMNGGLPTPNGPLRVTPDSSSEEATSSTHSHKTSRTSGTRERVRFSDKILYHALCCDDDEDDEEGEEGQATPDTDEATSPSAASPSPTLSSCEHSLHNCLDSSTSPSPDRVAGLQAAVGAPMPTKRSVLQPSSRKKVLRNSSTQTVSDKSTQTVLPYIPARQKAKEQL
ncbi:inhibitory synaptic factor 1-like [Brienomyrus brachyistius]|uniref:inhibitory synaptic factor 1-like n=1 Tax=Brienomyrus brachyistius TaxID=42636 RepID=UPI0020B3C986|nr:inhibitory synaptic factor 1-like [Brienomyrus brachyistius]